MCKIKMTFFVVATIALSSHISSIGNWLIWPLWFRYKWIDVLNNRFWGLIPSCLYVYILQCHPSSVAIHAHNSVARQLLLYIKCPPSYVCYRFTASPFSSFYEYILQCHLLIVAIPFAFRRCHDATVSLFRCCFVWTLQGPPTVFGRT